MQIEPEFNTEFAVRRYRFAAFSENLSGKKSLYKFLQGPYGEQIKLITPCSAINSDQAINFQTGVIQQGAQRLLPRPVPFVGLFNLHGHHMGKAARLSPRIPRHTDWRELRRGMRSLFRFDLTNAGSAKPMPSPTWTVKWQVKPVAFRIC